MKERPILFSSEMVRAILEGRKTQTRRIVKLSKVKGFDTHDMWKSAQQAMDGSWVFWSTSNPPDPSPYKRGGFTCPYGQPGDRLWVRETFDIYELEGESIPSVLYRADNTAVPILHTGAWKISNVHKWRPSIFMPRWASRITLENTGVRVERVQDITAQDIEREGAIDRPVEIGDAVDVWVKLWNSINNKPGKRWEDNPWVWVVDFKKL